jgi:hypothetical protein
VCKYSNLTPPSNGTMTSGMAADQIQPVSGRLRQIVYEFIVSRGEHGSTADEAELELGMRTPTCTARINELCRKLGLIVDSGRKRMTRSNRKAVVYIDAALVVEEVVE